MSRLIVIVSLTLDGVMQAPGRPDEDLRGGFAHGGWAVPYSDDAMGRVMGQRAGQWAALLLGRRTYEDFAAFWPRQKDNPYTGVLNRQRKYVASRTLSEPLPWVNSTLLGGAGGGGDATDAVATLKQDESGTDLVVLGSGELTRSLIRRGLVDEFILLIHPLVLGTGLRLFPDDVTVALRLVDSEATTTGVVITTYRPAEHREQAVNRSG
jgi:dihydrofolate reductase